MESLTFTNVTSNLNLNVTKSEEDAKKFIDLYEAYRNDTSSPLAVYRSVSLMVAIFMFLCNVAVVISSGLILRTGKQPKSTYILLGNVSLADMTYGIIIFIHMRLENPLSTDPMCIFKMGTMVCSAMVSIFSVGMIAVDRYIYILHGMHYHRWVNTRRIRISIAFIWLLGIFLGFLPAMGWVNNELKETRCYYITLFPETLILFISLLNITPIIVIVILYSIILVRAIRNVNEIKTSIKTIKSHTSEKPEMRINRGTGNLGNNLKAKAPSKATINKIKRRFPFKDCNNKDETKNSTSLTQNSKNNDNVNNTKDPLSNSNDIENVENEVQGNFDSKISMCTETQDITLSDRKPNTALSDSAINVAKDISSAKGNPKNNSKPKEPNKWRAITVVMLTTGSIIATWMPYFITIISFVFCEEKLTNPRCIKIRVLLGGPLAILAFFNSILNPLIYAWWHKGFKKSLKLYFQRYILKYLTKN